MDIKELLEIAFSVGHTIGYGNTENHYKPEFERWWNDKNTQEQVKNCSIPDVVKPKGTFCQTPDKCQISYYHQIGNYYCSKCEKTGLA